METASDTTPRPPENPPAVLRLGLGILALCVALAGCVPAAKAPPAAPDAEPCPTEPSTKAPGTSAGKPGRFAAGSPFDADYQAPVARDGKQLWARSCLWAEAPKLVVEKWLTAEPETAGKYVLVEFWATWCPPCRRSITLLNALAEKFAGDLVVIGISDETEEAVRRLKEPAIRYSSAIDTQARMKNALGVFGIPHVILIEPGGAVVWEGFPLLKGHELTEEKVEKILAVGRQAK
ncbi:MAG TPA: TlpA disulfide reductase family protein [Phycisphaerae bacterium]|nr:TlpA disulfide reductase family protein [Phycisphaerae bacterium]